MVRTAVSGGIEGLQTLIFQGNLGVSRSLSDGLFPPQAGMDTTPLSIFWKMAFLSAAGAPLLVLGSRGVWWGRRCRQLPARAPHQRPTEPPALGAPHWAAGKVSQGRRSKEGQKIRDGRDNGASPVPRPGTSTCCRGNGGLGRSRSANREGFWGWLRSEAPL